MPLLQTVKAILTRRAIWPFLGLGLASQAPMYLVGGTLKSWFKMEGVDLTQIGIFSLVLIPYSIKFLWAPFIDSVNLPGASFFGRKKTWGFLMQLILMGLLLFLSCLNPTQDTLAIFIICLMISFAASTQETVADGLRIDTLQGDDLKAGCSAYELGMRLGMLSAVAGMLFLSAKTSWQFAYQASCVLIGIGAISLCFVSEKQAPKKMVHFKQMIVSPFLDLIQYKDFWILCLFVVAYKLCNCMLGPMAYPFYFDIGFTREQVAVVSGTFGVFVTMSGVLLGGLAMLKWNYKQLLLWLGGIEIFTSIAFAIFALIGPSMPAFFAVILFDNILAGMGGVVWIAYLSSLCNRSYSATQYAFFNALNMIPLSILAGASGFLAKHMGWPIFFVFTGVLMLPALWMIKKGYPFQGKLSSK
ncbi:MAG: MFS transporter [Alphaproteobacteria bacterium]|nr:MFS transporter [Alphaproteobacteria bacterium]